MIIESKETLWVLEAPCRLVPGVDGVDRGQEREATDSPPHLWPWLPSEGWSCPSCSLPASLWG